MKKNKIYRFLTSIRLAIILLVIIAILCVLCTLIPQNQSETAYIQQYGRGGASIIVLLGLDHVLTSVWMYISGILFGINLTLCTVGRFQWALASSKKKFRIDVWGSPLLHVGLCIILVGAALSVLSGRQLYYEIPIGETANIAGASGTFGLRADDFEIEYYEDGINPRQYRSSVTIQSKDGASIPMAVEVNAPIKYDGVSILQQDYGWEVTVTVSTAQNSKEMKIKGEEWIRLSGEGESAISLGIAFYPDYTEEDGVARLKSYQDNNPYIVWVLSKGDTPIDMGRVALGEKGVIQEPLAVSFDSYRYYTGLQAKYDPGIPVIFGGFFLVCLGLLIKYAFAKKAEQKKENINDNIKGQS